MMNIETASYQVTRMLCKAYKLRNRREYPYFGSDPVYFPHISFNREMDTLSDIDRRAAVKGFNRAFDEALI